MPTGTTVSAGFLSGIHILLKLDRFEGFVYVSEQYY